VQDDKTYPDIGCCTKGAWFEDEQDVKDVHEQFMKLTDEDWDVEQRAKSDVFANKGKHPFAVVHKTDQDGTITAGKTRVVDGGCIFANRADGSVGATGKIGCAFHHMAQRLGGDHVDVMPNVCWQLPIRVDAESDEDNELYVTTIHPWDVDKWGGKDPDGTHDSWMGWWCIDTPDAYIGSQPLYKSMEHELRTLIGDGPYEVFVSVLEKCLADGTVARPKMSGVTANGGRKLLPLFVANREPARTAPK
jgi:hypothetical protein